MPIKVSKVADIVDGEVVFQNIRRSRQSEITAILTNLCLPADPIADSAWKLNLIIGDGPAARTIPIDMAPALSKSSAKDIPIFLPETRATPLIYFRDRLFMSERPTIRPSERAEVSLRVKKAVYDEEAELFSLRATVANMEAAIEFERSGLKRDPIPEDVKLLFWSRDGGGCVRCGSKQELHFDHIIPLAKGGGNSEANIQILCRTCNLKKSDKIAI